VTAAYAGHRVAVKPFEPIVPDHFYLVTSASQPLSMIGEAFCTDLREAFARMRGARDA
jgi:hypothetical protein